MSVSQNLNEFIGTPTYMAPEIKEKSGQSYTDKVDIYALGIILFELISKITTDHERKRMIN